MMQPEPKKLDLTNKSIGRIKRGNLKFEIILDPKIAFDYRMKRVKIEEINIHELLEIDTIFTDAKKGEKASDDILKNAFSTIDVFEITRKILIQGDIQITAEQRKELQEKKKIKIINFISTNCINPKTSLPHPPARIETAIIDVKVRIDPFDSVEEQAKRIIKEIQIVLPIRMEQVVLAVKIPAEDAPKAYGIVKRYASIDKEEWTKSGDWIGVLKMAAGLQLEFMEKIESLTKGRSEIKVMERSKY